MDTHKELQKKILGKQRAFGMTPVLPAFTGHVPPSFGNRFPDAKLRKTNWGAGFEDVFILDPVDSLFEKVGKVFLEKQAIEYGTDHFYSADTFNENVPPSNDSTFLSGITNKIFESMANADPKATWIMQGWMFHYNADFWKPAQMQALFAAVPDDRLIILDLYSESHPVWKETQAYYGKPWIWNMLQNFGGNVALFGRMQNVANDPAAAFNDPLSGKMTGIGLTPEGIEQNPALFELMLENVWQSEPVNLDEWLKGYASRRYGVDNAAIHNAWTILKNTVYSGGLTEGGQESIIVARPTFSSEGHRVLTELNYDRIDLVKAWEIFISQASQLSGSEGFQYDLVDITRQVLANYASPLQQEIELAYKNNDQKKFETSSKAFLELIDDIDTLLATRKEFLLGKWIHDARSWGKTDEEKNLYEFNARDLVTLWGDKNSELHEYSNRQWSGLLKGFYRHRWQKFFDHISSAMSNRSVPDLVQFEASLKDWEWQWVNDRSAYYPFEPSGDPIEISKYIFEKYRNKIFNL
jgi:alpha-N-acetylglucosaminidase